VSRADKTHRTVCAGGQRWAWRVVDPLPVLAYTMGRDEEDPDDESLESMVNSGDARA
jgi:hypothetical protein